MLLYGLAFAWACELAQRKNTSKTIHPQKKDCRPSDCTFRNDEHRLNFKNGTAYLAQVYGVHKCKHVAD